MAIPKVSGIYEIVNLVNGKRYVGSALNFEKRWREHRVRLRGGFHHSRHLQAAWNKYGEKAFAFRIIRQCVRAELLTEEQAELDKLPEYNTCRDARSTIGVRHSEETKRKISESHSGRKMPPRDEAYRAKLSAAHAGRKKSPEHMAALQAGRAARVFTDEQRANVSASLKAAYAEGRKRRDRPEEYRAKIAATLREKSNSPEMRERLRQQAANAWKTKTPEERKRHMEMVRAARRKTPA